MNLPDAMSTLQTTVLCPHLFPTVDQWGNVVTAEEFAEADGHCEVCTGQDGSVHVLYVPAFRVDANNVNDVRTFVVPLSDAQLADCL